MSRNKARAKSASAKLVHASSSLPDQSEGGGEFQDAQEAASEQQACDDLCIYEESELGSHEMEKESQPLMKVNIKQPESVVRFEEDLNKMAQMEDDFRKTAIDLQKKLGIPASGAVY